MTDTTTDPESSDAVPPEELSEVDIIRRLLALTEARLELKRRIEKEHQILAALHLDVDKIEDEAEALKQDLGRSAKKKGRRRAARPTRAGTSKDSSPNIVPTTVQVRELMGDGQWRTAPEVWKTLRGNRQKTAAILSRLTQLGEFERQQGTEIGGNGKPLYKYRQKPSAK